MSIKAREIVHTLIERSFFQQRREDYVQQLDKVKKIVDKKSDAVIYKGEVGGKPALIAFHGTRAQKPDMFFKYRSEVERDKRIEDFIQGRRRRKALKKELSDKRKATGRGNVKVGTIFYTSWGYDQTNVEFFQVTDLVGKKSVVIREIAQVRKGDDFMQGSTKPHINRFIGPPMKKQVHHGTPSGGATITIDKVRTGFQWAGEKKRWTSYG